MFKSYTEFPIICVDAAAMAMALKMLKGKFNTRGNLKAFTPVLIEPLRSHQKRTRQTLEGIQVASRVLVTFDQITGYVRF